MKKISHIKLIVLTMLLAFAGQSWAGLVSSCVMQDAAAPMNMSAHEVMGDGDQTMGSTGTFCDQSSQKCLDCECPLGVCALVVPSDTLSCAPPIPDKSLSELFGFPELEQISLLYRPPIAR